MFPRQFAELGLLALESRLVPAGIQVAPAALAPSSPATDDATATPGDAILVGTNEDGVAIYSISVQPKARQCNCAACRGLSVDSTLPSTAAVPVVVDLPQALLPSAASLSTSTASEPTRDASPVANSIPILMDETLPKPAFEELVAAEQTSRLAFIANPDIAGTEDADQITVLPSEVVVPVHDAIVFQDADPLVADELLA